MRRDALMQAGMLHFSTSGYHGTKVSDIVREAGVAQGTFYLYFDSKADLFAALLDEFIALLTQAVSSVTVDLDEITSAVQLAARIRMAVERALAVYRDNASLARIVIREGSSLAPEITDRWEQAVDRIAEIGTAVLDIAIARGLIPPQNSKIVPYCVLGMYERVAFRWLIEDQSTDIGVLAEAVTRFEMLGLGVAASPEMEAAISGELQWSPD
ncbi:MAG: TetR/AcrR family transcriptional regulator [Candidatus Promineifilaceae bacterium]|nr:TetR/AcrR family transcriptional regulator [Candidatus Promineifilaceae bacterium]